MKFIAIVIDTFREMKAKNLLWVFGIITVIFSCVYIFALSVKPAENDKIEIILLGKEAIVMDGAKFITKNMLTFTMTTSSMLIFLFIIALTFIMSNLLRPGNLDIHLSKPLSRSQLLLYKFLACVFNIAIMFFIINIIIWLILSIKTQIFIFEPLLAVLLIPIIFAIAFSIIVLCTVITRGAGAGIAVYLVYVYAIQFVLVNRAGLKSFMNQDWFSNAIDTLYHILPKINECIELSAHINESNMDWYPLWSSLGFMVVALFISCLIFHKKDY